jgi:predicted RNase H-like HicB family nuclease
MKTFTAYVEWDPESQLYVGMVPGVPGVHTQGATWDELHYNLKEVLELCLAKEANEDSSQVLLPSLISTGVPRNLGSEKEKRFHD